MNARERYEQLVDHTDLSDPLVADEIRRMIRQSDGLTDIQAHLPLLRAAAQGYVLEIGVRHGTSTAALLSGIEDRGGYLWSVDKDDCQVFVGHPQWTFIQIDSVKYPEVLKDLVPKELDLLLVDGGHSYEEVLSDLLNFGPRSEIVMCHDSGHSSGVIRAIKEYFSQTNCRQKHQNFYSESHGLTVMA